MKEDLIVCVLSLFVLGIYICQTVYAFFKDEDSLSVQSFWWTVLSFLGLYTVSLFSFMYKLARMILLKIIGG